MPASEQLLTSVDNYTKLEMIYRNKTWNNYEITNINTEDYVTCKKYILMAMITYQ